MTSIDSARLIGMFNQVAAALEADKDRLCALDGVIGDADHGIAMELGCSAVRDALAGQDASTLDPTAVFNTAAKSFLNAVGASSGPLYATAFMRAGAAVKGKPTLEEADMVAALQAMAKGIQDRGKAEIGEKTMIDAWVPAADAASRARIGQDPGAVPRCGGRGCQTGRRGHQEHGRHQGPFGTPRRSFARSHGPRRSVRRHGDRSDAAGPETGTVRTVDWTHMVNDETHTQRDTGLTPKNLRLWRGADLRETALLALFRTAIALTPPPKWAHIADMTTRLGKGRSSSRSQRFALRAEAVLADAEDVSILKLWRAYGAAVNRRRISILATRYCPDWNPRIELTGREHLDRAIGAGRGTILWLDNFINQPVIGKRAFSDLGYQAWQMSSVNHGFSSSRLGRRFLNPIQLAAEIPLVRGRIEFDAGSALTATREVTRCLARNEIVRITNNAYIGRQRYWVPFGKSALLPVVPAPLNIARRTGAAILPVQVVEREPFADYLVAVAPPLSIGTTRHEGFEDAAIAYARYLKPLVEAYPDQWRGWEGVRTASDDA